MTDARPAWLLTAADVLLLVALAGACVIVLPCVVVVSLVLYIAGLCEATWGTAGEWVRRKRCS